MPIDTPRPLFRKIDCVQLPVPDLEAGLRFYRDQLGHALIWRTGTAAGLRMLETDAEIVLHTEPRGAETDILVDSADDASQAVSRAGGRVVVAPFDIPIGRCTVVEDPWGNRLVLLDGSKGSFATDAQGNVLTDASGALRVERRPPADG